MNIFGGWLPFVGFKPGKMPLEVAREHGIEHGVLVPGNMDAIQTEDFEIGWLGYSIGFTYKVRIS